MITKNDIKALRQADTVVYHHLSPNNRNGHDGMIRALKNLKIKKGQFSIEETAEYEIPVDSCISNYGRDGINSEHLCAAVVTHPDYSNLAGTLARMIKENDIVTLHWSRNNDSDTIRAANLVSDNCELIIKRGKETLTFLIDELTCRDNSARMIHLPLNGSI